MIIPINNRKMLSTSRSRTLFSISPPARERTTSEACMRDKIREKAAAVPNTKSMGAVVLTVSAHRGSKSLNFNVRYTNRPTREA